LTIERKSFILISQGHRQAKAGKEITMVARELVSKITNEFEKNGIELKNVYGDVWRSEHEYVTGERYFMCEETHRRNGTAVNVTATIFVHEVGTVWGTMSCSLRQLAKIKVPKNASDKVVANRVSKAIEAFNAH
jgi:hypothetical protein